MPASASNLWLIPTRLELEKFNSAWVALTGQSFPEAIQLCGFGAIGAAASTSFFLQKPRAQVCLLGIAGTYDPETLPPGSAWQFSAVRSEGIGAESEGQLQLPSQLGFPQWSEPGSDQRPRDEAAPAIATGDIYESLPLATTDAQAPTLLTVGHASGNLDTVARREQQFPDARAEDMEGFGVALACQLYGTRCSILRGISNVAGQRDLTTWQIEPAFRSLAQLILQRFFASP